MKNNKVAEFTPKDCELCSHEFFCEYVGFVCASRVLCDSDSEAECSNCGYRDCCDIRFHKINNYENR